jgi:hypothetical protein
LGRANSAGVGCRRRHIAASLSALVWAQSGHAHQRATEGEIAQMPTGESLFSRARAAVAILTSVVALGFSGYSFYETVVKQPELRIYTSPLVYMYRVNFLDVFAIPITVSNDGARRGTVLSFDLEVTHRETGKTMTFQNQKFGEGPGAGARLFTPMTVAGRSSATDIVLFYAMAPGSFVQTTGPVTLPLRFALKMNVDSSGDWLSPRQPAPVVFEMTADHVQSLQFMERGSPTMLHDARWMAALPPPKPKADDRQALQAYQQSIFPAQRAAIHRAAGVEVPIDVHWDAIARPDEGESYSDENYWTNIFFVPLAQALSQVASNSAGKQAIRDKLKRIVVAYDKATAPVSTYEDGVTFENGILTLNFAPFTDAPYIEARVKAIRKRLEAKL